MPRKLGLMLRWLVPILVKRGIILKKLFNYKIFYKRLFTDKGYVKELMRVVRSEKIVKFELIT